MLHRVYALAHTAVLAIAVLSAGCANVGDTGADNNPEVLRYVTAAESALRNADYMGASTNYRRAAELSSNIDTVREAAEVCFNYGSTADAAAVAERWSQLEPDEPTPYLYRGRLAIRDDDGSQAAAQFVRFVELSEPQTEAVDRLNGVLLNDGTAQVALDAAQAISSDYPGMWQAQRLLSRTAMRAEEKNLAMEAAERAYELDADSFAAALLQAQAIIIGGAKDAGLEFAEEVAATASGSEERLEYAALLAASEELEDAQKIVTDVVETEPDNAEALKALALINIRSGELDTAWSQLTSLAEDPAYQHDAVFYLGGIAESQQRNLQAIRLYSQLGDGQHTVLAQQRVSRILVGTGRAEGAIEHLEEYSARFPEHGFQLLLPRAALLRELDRNDEALAIYDQLLALRPASEPLLLTRAETLLAEDRVDEAIAVYREAVEQRPESAISLNALGYTLADYTREFAEARELIEKALALDPENAAIIDSMGWVLFKQRKYKDALVHLERAWELIKDPEVAAHLGETLWKLGKKDEARAILKEAYDRSPESKPLRETLERLLKEKGGVTS